VPTVPYMHPTSIDTIMVHYLIEQGVDYTVRDASHGDIAWNIHESLSENLLNPESPACDWALKVKQQLIDRGVRFPPLSPREVRWKEGKPNRYDIKARKKELEEALEKNPEKGQRAVLKKELEDLKKMGKQVEKLQGSPVSPSPVFLFHAPAWERILWRMNNERYRLSRNFEENRKPRYSSPLYNLNINDSGN